MPHHGQIGVNFDSAGYRLLGTLFLARGDEPKPTAVILHGIPGIEKNFDIAHGLRANGWNSLLFHYRGCWGSEGRYHIKTIPQDVSSALNLLASGRYPQINPSKLMLIGHSLGGWAAILVASKDPRVKGVIAISTITDPREIHFSEQDASERITPWLSGISPADFIVQWRDIGECASPIQVVALISPRPIIIIHGRADELVPVSQSDKLFENAQEPRILLIHDEADHSFVWHRRWLLSRILEWLEKF